MKRSSRAMKKFMKYLCMILAVVTVFALAAGCSMFQQNEERYRKQTAIKVGDEIITVQEVTEFFESNGATYIQYGYDAQSVWDSLIHQYIAQMIAVNEYKQNSSVKTYDGELNRKYKNGEYLTNDDLLYFEKKVQLSVLNTLDSLLETVFTDAGYTFDSASDERAEETEIKITEDLSWTNRNNTLNMKTAEESLEAYKVQKDNVSIEYVYTDMEDARLLKAVKALNDRISNDKDEISVDSYVEAQKEAYREFKQGISAYYDSVSAYLAASVEVVVRQQLYIDYQTNKYSGIEKESEFRTRLTAKLNNLIAQDKEKYSLNPSSFETFVTGLSDTSFIYYVPEQYAGKYGFVKNLLIPFSDEQSKILTSYSSAFGSTSDVYLAKRAELAKEIVVTDFIDAPDAKDSEKASAGFTIDGYQVNGSEFFADKLNGVTADGFVELMFRYNTDTAQHNKAYDYVIAKEAPDASGTADKWVTEFAAEARRLANEGVVGGIGYALTDYGVHILFYSGDVTADTFDWDEALKDQKGAGTASYRFYKTYLDAVKSSYYSDLMDETYKEYESAKKITIYKNVLKSYCSGYGIEL